MIDSNFEGKQGIALLCDAQGSIQKILLNTLVDHRCLRGGEQFKGLFDPASRAKSESFFSALRQQKAAFNWELNVPCGAQEEIKSLQFAGALSEIRFEASEPLFLVIGAKSRKDVSMLFEALIRPDQKKIGESTARTDEVKSILSEQSDRDNFHYEELSRLNNELATVQRELAKRNFELARLNEQKNQFLGIAAHDLRNPLEVVMIYSQFLLEDAARVLSEEQIDFVNKIYSSSGFMLSLVNDFLDFSKIEAGRLVLDKTPTDLTKLVGEVVERTRVLAEKKRIQIVFNETGSLPPFKIDASKIEQVLNNLLGNALKFSPAETVVDLRLEESAQGAIISISDNGPGIAETETETLFQPFVGGGSKPTHGEKSSGLGLAIVKKIVEAHGGNVRLETKNGSGTTFYISLPAEIRREDIM